MIREADAVAVDVIVALEGARIPCAIGGAIAFGFWGGPRSTTDANVNAFVQADRYEELLSVLFAAGCTGDRLEALKRAREGSAIFLWKDGVRVDVFVPSIVFDAEAQKTVRMVPLHERQVPVLSAEATCIYKLLFFRSKDLFDLAKLVALQGKNLDSAYVRRWMVDMLGADSDRVEKWDEIVKTHGPR